MRDAGLAIDVLVDDLRSQVATHPSSRNAVVQRLQKIQTAHKVHPGKPVDILKRLLAGEVVATGTNAENMAIANAIMGLPDGFENAETLNQVVLAMLDKAPEGAASRSAIYRAACRLDEILYR